MKDYDSTVARIAGNTASGMELTIAREPEDEARSAEEIIAIVAVKVARAIIAEVQRTEPPS